MSFIGLGSSPGLLVFDCHVTLVSLILKQFPQSFLIFNDGDIFKNTDQLFCGMSLSLDLPDNFVLC